MPRIMDYIGIDPAVGLECSSCKHMFTVMAVVVA
jgi:hypothetical protein